MCTVKDCAYEPKEEGETYRGIVKPGNREIWWDPVIILFAALNRYCLLWWSFAWKVCHSHWNSKWFGCFSQFWTDRRSQFWIVGPSELWPIDCHGYFTHCSTVCFPPKQVRNGGSKILFFLFFRVRNDCPRLLINYEKVGEGPVSDTEQ